MKHLLFLDLTQPSTIVELPDDIQGTIGTATLINWCVVGHPEVPVEDDGRTSQFYIQLKFEGALETRTVTHGSRTDMFPLPIFSLNDWPMNFQPITLPVRHSTWTKRFKISLFNEGLTPSPYTPITLPGGLRLLLWIELETL
jgi:hypothetical protein